MVINLLICAFLAFVLLYLLFTTYYYLFFAFSYFFGKKKSISTNKNLNKFAIIVPAHNEEMLIADLCKSLSQLNYHDSLFAIYIIADNCTDRTAEVCGSYPCKVLVRTDEANSGKGQAINWALSQISLDDYEAILIVDADNYVDSNLLVELNRLINDGEQAIQCCNSVGNRSDSWFTRLLFISRTINNLLYHHAKYKLGLSSYLMGNGICFTSALIKRKGWTAFSIGEDWEYYAQLLEEDVRIAFAVDAKVFHQESKSLHQATSQRLRWSSGKFQISKKLGLRLLQKGIRNTDWKLIDGSLPLLLPNYSLLVNLSILLLLAVFFINTLYFHSVLLLFSLIILFGQFLLLVLGVILSGDIIQSIKAIVLAPVFLLWKMVIDVISFTGLYRENKWVRTKRHISKH